MFSIGVYLNLPSSAEPNRFGDIVKAQQVWTGPYSDSPWNSNGVCGAVECLRYVPSGALCACVVGNATLGTK